ncbi:MAG: S9 family peptidase [Chloroflexota bacterium]|nr:S9 family peptidase [Chloroflexota bacterium]
MRAPRVAPYGTWKSPITSEFIVSETIDLGQIALDGDCVYWIEMRPSEGGRSVVVRRSADGRIVDVTPPSFNARTRAHEYGGGAFLVADATVYFSNFSDQRLYRHVPPSEPEPIAPEASMRYADCVLDRRRGRLICVCEDHTDRGQPPVNTLVGLALDNSGASRTLASGNDFYSSPRLSPDGSRLAWLAWNHPNMPWDTTELWVAEVQEDGLLSSPQRVAGGADESMFQPEWSPGGVLHFVSDRSGWWNLYRWRNDREEPLCEMEAEFGLPQWVFRMSTYGFESETRIICAYNQAGRQHLASLDTRTKQLETIATPYSSFRFIDAVAGHAAFLGGSATEPASVVLLDTACGKMTVLRRSIDVAVDAGYLSVPEPIEFPTGSGQTAYALYYAPRNPGFHAPPGERPPLIVMSHGGPTSAASSTLNLTVQYWTSRGIAVVDVDYGGSTGYGRAYRRRLEGQWGIVDVDDCVNAACHLVNRGDVDGDRLAIRGGSAGGYTTLCALTFRDTFRAGASYYGVSDLEALTRETHKFESRYLDKLVGPYPERRDIYLERSPINSVERLSCPVIFFQGLDDRIVPPDQAEAMVSALREKGIPVAYLAFEGEQHGFRRAETIKRCLEAELYFYSRVFSFEPAEPVEPVTIENL